MRRVPPRNATRQKSNRCTAVSLTPVLFIAGAVAAGAYWASGADPELAARGDGHGRGLGQNGAYDYAKAGWTVEQILVHYYPGTTLGALPPTKISVRLQDRDDDTLDVYSSTGLTVAGRQASAGEAAHLTPIPGGAKVTITSGCSGNVLWEGETDNAWVDPVDAGPARPGEEHLTMCDGDDTYRGSLGVALEGDRYRTVNYVDIEDYLLGVVPHEMTPNWADDGGAEALRAQAIAARSYAATEDRTDYAQTCDTTDCQMYGGSADEDERTNEAVRSTAGSVLMMDGKIVHSEYSASSDRDGDGEDALATRPPETGAPILAAPAPDATTPGTEAAPDGGLSLEIPIDLDPNVVVAGASPIDAKYRQLGGMASSIGAPIGPEMRLPTGEGTFRVFSNGAIIHTEDLGAQVVDLSFLDEIVAAAEEN